MSPTRVFIVRDARQRELDGQFAKLGDDLGHGYEVIDSATDGAGEQGSIPSNVTASLDAADHVVAVVGPANANVGWEIGYALGKGARLTLVQHTVVPPP